MPRRAFLLLALFLVACDAADPYPDAVLVATVRDASGAPAAGLDVFLTTGNLVPSEARIASGSPAAFEFRGLAPTPTHRLAIAYFSLPTAQVVTVRLLDVSGALLATLVDGETREGGQSVVVSLEAYPSGVYFVEVEAGGETIRRPAVKSDAEDIRGFAFHLGQTDADGVLVVTDRTRLPMLYNLAPFLTIDHEGNLLGDVQLTRAAGLVAQDAEGRTDGVPIVLRNDRTEVDFTFAP